MKKIIFVLVVCLVVVVGLFFYVKYFSGNNQFRVVFFDVGQGDAALINFKNGNKMLVDCGPDKKVLNKLGEHLPFYDKTIDYLMVSHFDLDHYGGCLDVLRRYRVKNIIINDHRKPYDKYWQNWNELMRSEGAVIKIIAGVETWQIASSTLEFLSPAPELTSAIRNSNDKSIVFSLLHGDQKILFTGDIEEGVEQALVTNYCQMDSCPRLAANLLKAGHHGSDTSSSQEFLQAVNPKQAVISAGANNKFGHPSRRVLNRLKRAGAEVFRTDEIGDIVFSF